MTQNQMKNNREKDHVNISYWDCKIAAQKIINSIQEEISFQYNRKSHCQVFEKKIQTYIVRPIKEKIVENFDYERFEYKRRDETHTIINKHTSVFTFRKNQNYTLDITINIDEEYIKVDYDYAEQIVLKFFSDQYVNKVFKEACKKIIDVLKTKGFTLKTEFALTCPAADLKRLPQRYKQDSASLTD